uniref:SCAN box domain-containing protein n=1 Tax=Denticeps clupeoides TaxID=299321 RepID=A0AAY3ZYS8_9TELE
MSLADEFIQSPSYELLSRCTKDNLLYIAENYAIDLTSEDKKLKESLFKAVEPYRQKFRRLSKTDRITYVEFAREKENLFDRWCTSEHVTSREQLRELVLLEEFKNCVPDAVATYLHDRQVTTLAQAAVCADQYALTHKSVFVPFSSSPSRCIRS